MGDKGTAIEQKCSSGQTVPIKRKLIEVYSMRLCTKKWCKEAPSIFGFAELKPSGSQIQCPAIIFQRMSQDISIINKRGIVTLNGPTSGVEVNDEVAIHLCLWDLRFPRYSINEPGSTLWRACDEETDKLICKEVNSVFGPVEVVFAVYNDGVEARLDVSLANWDAHEGVQAFGDVETGNSRIGGLRARSSLFRKSYEEAIEVEPGSDSMSLPLCRSVTVVPRGSALLVNVTIWRVENSCRHHIPILAKLSFEPMPAAATETRVVYGDCGNVVVRVTWSG